MTQKINKNLAAFSLIEFLLVITILGIIWGSANLSASLLKEPISQNSELARLKIALEEQVIYANLFKQEIELIPMNLILRINGNKFIKEIHFSDQIQIISKDMQLRFYPKQVCSPANISFNNLMDNCSLVISLRCRIRIQCQT